MDACAADAAELILVIEDPDAQRETLATGSISAG
jgi:hypothetical protein